ncbi:MAG: hypothetical protein QXY62_06240 [Candidatus Altiarchaeota archaeon]
MFNPLVFLPNPLLDMKECDCGLFAGAGTGKCECGWFSGGGYPDCPK